jgi:hypothetical protein
MLSEIYGRLRKTREQKCQRDSSNPAFHVSSSGKDVAQILGRPRRAVNHSVSKISYRITGEVQKLQRKWRGLFRATSFLRLGLEL